LGKFIQKILILAIWGCRPTFLKLQWWNLAWGCRPGTPSPNQIL